MFKVPEISPFTFIVWKEDAHSLVASTKDASLGFMALLHVDGVDADDIVKYAKEQQGEAAWQVGFAKNFPVYIHAVATAMNKTCFTTTQHAKVEYSDLNTGEVLETELEATADAYNEAVRIETAREEHAEKQEEKRFFSAADGKARQTGTTSDDDNEDHYEDEEGPDVVERTKLALLEMVSTQMQTALSMGKELGLTHGELKKTYSAVISPFPVPETLEECAAMAHNDSALQKYMANF